jgi:hypothetical protein
VDGLIELTAADNWTYTFRNLDEKKDGKDIIYTVAEVSKTEGYDKTDISGDAKSGFEVTNSHTPAVREISAEKVWRDNDNAGGLRPVSVKVHLLADGRIVGSEDLRKASDLNSA